MKFSRFSIMGCATALALFLAVGNGASAQDAAATTAKPAPLQMAFEWPFKLPWGGSATAAIKVHPVDSYPTAECPQIGQEDFVSPPKFDGKLVYRCAFQGVMKLSYKLKDEKAREDWAKDWELKHDNDHALDTPEGTDKAVKEMLDGIGERFNYYFDEAATKANAQSFNAYFVGIGAQLTQTAPKGEKHKRGDRKVIIDKDHQVLFIDSIPEGPASRTDLKPGDIITAVNGVKLDGLTLEQAIEEKIKGPKGTKVTLTVLRGDLSHDVTIERDTVVQHVVTQKKFVADSVFYVRIEAFNSQYYKTEVKDAFKAGQGAKVYILDLRHNPGGFLHYATFLAEGLIPEGHYLTTIGRDGTQITTDELTLIPLGTVHREDNDVKLEGREPLLIPADAQLIVLIDEGSASASEIVAGTLQANHRARIVGTTSHGKGEVQTEIALPFKRAERVISAEFLPGGRQMDWVGILPDVEVAADIKGDPKNVGDPDKDAQLKAGIEQAQKLVAEHDQLLAKEAAAKKAHEDEFLKEQELIKKMQQGDDAQDSD